jgi:hypothetical protein
MNVAFEEQNAVLQRHTQSMSSARERLEQELALEERRTLALQQQLQAVRQALTASFASLPVPGAQPRPHLRSRPHFSIRPRPSSDPPPRKANSLVPPSYGPGRPLSNPLTRRHRGDTDPRDAGLLHGAASWSHRARPRAARETDRARQGDPGAGSQVRDVGGESGVKGESGSA